MHIGRRRLALLYVHDLRRWLLSVLPGRAGCVDHLGLGSVLLGGVAGLLGVTGLLGVAWLLLWVALLRVLPGVALTLSLSLLLGVDDLLCDGLLGVGAAAHGSLHGAAGEGPALVADLLLVVELDGHLGMGG